MRWLAAAAAGGALAFCCALSPAVAASTGGVCVAAVAADDGTPVTDGVVFLVGWSRESSRTAMTNPIGKATFADVPVGTYRLIVRHAGFEDAVADVAVDDQRLTTVKARLARSPKVLGHIRATATSSASVTKEPLSSASAQRRLSGSLLDAMNMLGGTQVALDKNGIPDGISLRGHDPSATSYIVDGMRASGAAAAHAFDPDLLSSAQVDLQTEQIGLLLDGPTETPVYTSESSLGGFAASRTKQVLQSTSGATGLMFAHIERGADSALNGATYEDASGLTYDHSGTLHAVTSLAKLTAPLTADWRASGALLTTDRVEEQIPAYFDGPLPAGIGPGNDETDGSGSFTFNANGRVRSWLGSLSYGAIWWRDGINDQARVVATQHQPFAQTTIGSARSMSAAFERSVSDSQTLGLSLVDYGNRSSSTTFDTMFAPARATTASVDDTSIIELHDDIRPAGGGLARSATVDLIRSPGTGWSPSFDGKLNLPNGANTWSLEASTGAATQDAIFAQPLSDPAAATYDCSGGSITAQGPGGASGSETATKVQAGYERRFSRGSAGVSIYDESDSGAIISDAVVAAPFEPAGFLPPGYLAALQAGWSAYGGCAGAPPTASKLYFLQPVSGLRLHYAGANLALRYRLGAGLALSASYDLTTAELASTDQRLASPTSPYIVGIQLPNVAPSKLSLTADWSLPDGRSELLANALSYAANNPRNLPAYMLYTIGLERKISGITSLTVVGSNVGHNYVGLFTSPRYAVPLPTVGGAGLPTLAAPLPQPSITLLLRIRWGPGGD